MNIFCTNKKMVQLNTIKEFDLRIATSFVNILAVIVTNKNKEKKRYEIWEILLPRQF